MKKSKLLGLLSAAVLCLTSGSAWIPANAADTGVMRDMSTMELIQDMGIGINLGNTMESCGAWIDQWGDGTATQNMDKHTHVEKIPASACLLLYTTNHKLLAFGMTLHRRKFPCSPRYMPYRCVVFASL